MNITLETLRETRRELESAQMDAELDIFLSDDGPATLLLAHGGRLVEIAGNYYAIAADLFRLVYKVGV